MTAYLEDEKIDTSPIIYPETGIRLTKFVKTVYGDKILEMIEKGVLVLRLNRDPIKFDENFRNYRVHEDTIIEVNVSKEINAELWEILQKYHDANPNNWDAKINEMIDSFKQSLMIA